MATIVFIFIVIGIAAGVFSLLFTILKRPMALAFRLLLNAISGFVFLFIFNIFGSYWGITLGLNWLNAIVTGVLGIPGVVLLLLVRYIL